jgi:hypothetical protein
MKNRLLHGSASLACAALAVLLTGCFDKFRSFVLIVERAPDLAAASFEVDLVGATIPQKEALETADYWGENSAAIRARYPDKLNFQFKLGSTNRFILCLNDRVIGQKWKDWEKRGVQHLVVLADLKGGGKNGGRAVFPLTKKALNEKYPDAVAFRILIDSAGIDVQPLRTLDKDLCRPK